MVKLLSILSIIYILTSTTSYIFIASLIFIKRNIICNGSLCFHHFLKNIFIFYKILLRLAQAHLILYRALRKSQINPLKKACSRIM